MDKLLLTYGLPKETFTHYNYSSETTKAIVLSWDGETDFSDIVTRVLQGDT